jgi:CRP/FNR family transcriptional regulator, cyclic AMP receptor protein
MDASERSQAIDFLPTVPLFGGLPDAALQRLLERMQRRACTAGQVICAEGDPAREMFIVRSGAVEVRKRAADGHTCLARLRAGDEFGEMSLIDIQPRSASVVACEPTELYVLGNMDLLALYEEDLGSYTFFLQNLCREMSRRLRLANVVIIDAVVSAQRAMKLTDHLEAQKDLEAARFALVDALGALDRAQLQLLAPPRGAD